MPCLPACLPARRRGCVPAREMALLNRCRRCSVVAAVESPTAQRAPPTPATFHLRAANISCDSPSTCLRGLPCLLSVLCLRAKLRPPRPRPGHVVACACQQNRCAFPLATAVCLPNRAHPSPSHLDASGPIAASLQHPYGETPAPSSVTDPDVLTTGPAVRRCRPSLAGCAVSECHLCSPR